MINFKSVREEIREEINVGLTGKSAGLQTGTGRLNAYLNGIQQGRIYLIGAESGIGKTTFADAIMLSSIKAAIDRDIPIKILYFSFEISAKMKIVSWVCALAGQLYDVPLTPDLVLGKIEKRVLSDKELEAYTRAEEALEFYLPHIALFDREMTPSGIYNTIIQFFELPDVCTITRDKPAKEGKKGYIRAAKRTQKWKQGHVLGIIDHIALGIPERGQTLKNMIDDISRKAVITRNLFNMSWFIIQQFNMEMANNKRIAIKGNDEIAPHQLDFGDSRYTYRDADAVIGLVAPGAQGVSDKYRGYEIKSFGTYLLMAFLLKNRYGMANRIIPYVLDPIKKVVHGLPQPSHLPGIEAAEELTRKIDVVCQSFYQNQKDQY